MKPICMSLIYTVACLACVVGSKMNVLFLVADDLRPNLGTYSSANSKYYKMPPMHTPNLDALAQDSIIFDHAYSQIALCGPSRTSVLTGRRPDTTRVTDNDLYFRNIGSTSTIFETHSSFDTTPGGSPTTSNKLRAKVNPIIVD